MLVDTHAHLSSLDSADEIIEQAQQQGVERIINISTNLQELRQGLNLGKKYSCVQQAVAITPHDIEELADEFPIMVEHARQQDVIAIGETGLDYYKVTTPKQLQHTWFCHHIALALETNLPLLIHCRDAFADVTNLLTQHFYPSKRGGILHCFTGTLQEAQALIKLGFLISFSGMLTYKKNDALREVAQALPLESIVLETDAPYLAPQSKRGQINQPGYMVETAHMLASLKQLSLEQVAMQTTENVFRLFPCMRNT